MHVAVDLKVLYFGTPVVLIGSRNPDGSGNIAPMSSAWWLGRQGMLGLDDSSQTSANLVREGHCVLNLVPSTMAAAVDRLALTTATPAVPPHKAARGYRYVRDKFATAGLTEIAAELVESPRVAECPIHLECEVDAVHPFGTAGPSTTAFRVRVLRAHVDDAFLVPDTAYVDPILWDPLIMKFCEYFGDAAQVHPSRLATGWRMPHRSQRSEG